MEAQDLVGVWIIRFFHLVDQETGAHSAPWGEHPSGTLMFHPGGRMFALIAAERSGAPATVADQAAAFQSMLAYSGAYRIDPPNRLVTTVDMSWFAPWLGSEQLRFCALDGDDLTLTSAPLHMPREDGRDVPVFAAVRWRRERSVGQLA